MRRVSPSEALRQLEGLAVTPGDGLRALQDVICGLHLYEREDLAMQARDRAIRNAVWARASILDVARVTALSEDEVRQIVA